VIVGANLDPESLMDFVVFRGSEWSFSHMRSRERANRGVT
jgi:hypothetical protein